MIIREDIDLDGLDDLESLKKKLKKIARKVTKPIKKVAKKVGRAVKKTAKKVGKTVKKLHKSATQITKRISPVQIYRAKRKAKSSSGGGYTEVVDETMPQEAYDPNAYAPVPGESWGAPGDGGYDYDYDGQPDETQYDEDGNPIVPPPPPGSSVPAPVPAQPPTIAPTLVEGVPDWIWAAGGIVVAGGISTLIYMKRKGKL